MRLLVTRPRPDAETQARALRALGHEVLVEPMLHIEYLPPEALPLDGVRAVLATSRNALRAVADRPELARLRGLPLFAVGEATAALAWDLRFAHVEAARSTGESLAALAAARLDPAHGALLHLSGEALAFDLKGALEARGFRVHRAVVYRARGADRLSEAAQAGLRERRIDAVVLMSPRTAARFADLVAAHGLDAPARGLRYFCLSAAVADALRPVGCRNVSVPVTPSPDELLALIGGQAADCP